MSRPGWPEWLTPEYSALHTVVENAIKSGQQHVYDSADAAGMNWTADGMLSCEASAVLNALGATGWTPPTEIDTTVESAPWPTQPYDEPEMYPCEGGCGEVLPEYEVGELTDLNGDVLVLCGACEREQIEGWRGEILRWREHRPGDLRDKEDAQ